MTLGLSDLVSFQLVQNKWSAKLDVAVWTLSNMC